MVRPKKERKKRRRAYHSIRHKTVGSVFGNPKGLSKEMAYWRKDALKRSKIKYKDQFKI
jgi:UDP-N-acetylenolpyruvoylglucosamine reductase